MKHQSNQPKRLQFYVSELEYEVLQAEFESAGFQSMSGYLRKKIIGSGIIIPYPKATIQRLDQLGIQHKRIGNNINQIAQKVHVYSQKGVFQASILGRYNQCMQEYLQLIADLSKLYRQLIQKFSH